MNIPVLIEPVPGSGYRAKTGEPFASAAEGSTPDEALTKVKGSVQRQLESGARIVSLQVSPEDHSWLPFAGMFEEDDPTVAQWLEILRSRREDPGAN